MKITIKKIIASLICAITIGLVSSCILPDVKSYIPPDIEIELEASIHRPVHIDSKITVRKILKN